MSRLQISEGAAIELLRRIFGSDPKTNKLSLKQIYANAGRSTETDKRNRGWLNTVLAKLKDYQFVKTNTSYVDGRYRVINLELTEAGQRVFNKKIQNSANEKQVEITHEEPQQIGMDELSRLIEQWRMRNPGFKRIEHSNWEVVFKSKETSD